jgi:hypothetical protein
LNQDAHSKARLSIAWATWAAKDIIGTARRYEACSCRQTIRADDRSGRRESTKRRPEADRSPQVARNPAPNCQRQARSLGQRETHRPDFEVNLVDLAWLERLALVMGISRWLSTRWQCHLPPLQFSERRPVLDPLSVVILQQFSSFSSD